MSAFFIVGPGGGNYSEELLCAHVESGAAYQQKRSRSSRRSIFISVGIIFVAWGIRSLRRGRFRSGVLSLKTKRTTRNEKGYDPRYGAAAHQRG